jgi:pimeloyl-ACP methyl ester carboxylesterase
MMNGVDLNVTDADLVDLLGRVRRTRWAPQWPVAPWGAGIDQVELRRLAHHWALDFDWRAYERHIDSLPWATANLDGTPLSSWAERTNNIVRYTTMPRGGHFAPHEEPALLAADITAFLRELPGLPPELTRHA